MATSRSYHQFLIESLKAPEEAALYLWAILQEENPEPQLLPAALSDVEAALANSKMSSEAVKLHQQKLNEILEKKGSEAIYGLAEWLKALGLELTVTVKEESQFIEENDKENNQLLV